MPAQYAALPHSDDVEEREVVKDEVQFTLQDSDDEDYDDADGRKAESRPLKPVDTSSSSSSAQGASAPAPDTPGDDSVTFDYPPPPGSPPRRDRALPGNDLGNTNGLIPDTPIARFQRRFYPGWLAKAAGAVLPTHYAQRLGVVRAPFTSAIGGGTRNDGVFANVTAKPTAPRQIVEGDDVYVVPEDAQTTVPPSYATAQADAVPPYWETGMQAPTTTPAAPGEMVIEGEQTGSLFSFLWNMLVSISFQFVGFLLTYLLHTTHAAKFGSRAGLGVTLIQYGFALRSKGENDEDALWLNTETTVPHPTFSTAAEAEDYYSNNPNATLPSLEIQNAMVNDMMSQWLAFLLMTIGWFILLISILGFWRVKKFEATYIASNRPVEQPSTSGNDSTINSTEDSTVIANIDRAFALRGLFNATSPITSRFPRINSMTIRQGLGLSVTGGADSPVDGDRRNDQDAGMEGEFMIPEGLDPERLRRVIEAVENERRLQHDLRAAGLL